MKTVSSNCCKKNNLALNTFRSIYRVHESNKTWFPQKTNKQTKKHKTNSVNRLLSVGAECLHHLLFHAAGNRKHGFHTIKLSSDMATWRDADISCAMHLTLRENTGNASWQRVKKNPLFCYISRASIHEEIVHIDAAVQFSFVQTDDGFVC